ncbi:hypothetical protein QE152_g5754 [Popillia japonica]|uniref:Ankyrin repeat protein n=1 Tax=Popillia japonica TaxID=7064 RepID=A0AAW1MH18_POPJA
MSQTGGKKGGGAAKANAKDTSGNKNDESKDPKGQINKTGSKDNLKDNKDETGSNAEADDTPASKPQSAGASTRDAAQKIMVLCQKGEWGPVDQLLKSMEKAIANAGDDANTIPLLGVADLATGMTPLMYAVKDNRTSLLDKLIDLGSDVGARNNVSC